MQLEHIDKVADRLAKLVPEASHKQYGIAFNIKCFVQDIAKVIENIKETSLSESDKIHRLEKLEKETGIDYLTLKKLC